MSLEDQLSALVKAVASSSAKPQVFAFFITDSKPKMTQMVVPRHGGRSGQ